MTERVEIGEAQAMTLSTLKANDPFFKKKRADVLILKRGLSEQRVKVMHKQNKELFNHKLPEARAKAADVYQDVGMPGWIGKKEKFDR